MTLNKIGAIVSTAYLMMKFFTDNGEIATVKMDQAATYHCYNASLEVKKTKKDESQDSSRPPNSLKVMMVDLDARKIEGRRPESDCELEEVQIDNNPGQTTQINKALPTMLKQDLVTLLKSKVDLFAWIATNMPGIDLKFLTHPLSIFPWARPVAQKRRKMSPDRAFIVQEQV